MNIFYNSRLSYWRPYDHNCPKGPDLKMTTTHWIFKNIDAGWTFDFSIIFDNKNKALDIKTSCKSYNNKTNGVLEKIYKFFAHVIKRF